MSIPSIYKVPGLSQTDIKGYETLRKSDPRHYTDSRIQNMILKNEHKDPLFHVLVNSVNETTPTHIQRAAGGLFNKGNTCWLNASIQMLFATTSPYYASLVNKTKEMQDPLHQARSQALLDIIQLSKQPATAKNDQALHQALEVFVIDLFQNSSLDSLSIRNQQDAHEGYDALISYLGLKEPQSFSFTALQYGHETKRSSIKTDKESILVLRHGKQAQKAKSIQELFNRANMCVEEMKGQNQLQRPDGIGYEDGKRVNFLSLQGKIPTHIKLEVPRFQYDRILKRRIKDSSPIQFNDQVQLPFYSSDGKKLHGLAVLQLKSVICHLGRSAYGGHYITLEKQPNGLFTLYDDSQIIPNISVARAQSYMNQGGYIADYTLQNVVDASEFDASRFPTIEQALGLKAQNADQQLVSSNTPSSDEGLGSDTYSLGSAQDLINPVSTLDTEQDSDFALPPTSPESTIHTKAFEFPVIDTPKLEPLAKAKASSKIVPRTQLSSSFEISQLPELPPITQLPDLTEYLALASTPLPPQFPEITPNLALSTSSLAPREIKVYQQPKFSKNIFDDLMAGLD